MRKTLIHVIDNLRTGGAEVLLAGVVTSMKDFDHVIITLFPENDFKDQLKDIPIYCLQYKSKLDIFKARKKIRSIIRKHKGDLIHAHLLTATFVARWARPKELPFYFSVHNILSESAFRKFRSSFLVEKWFYKKDHQAIFVSKNARDDYDEWIGIKGKEYLLPNYVNDEFFFSENSKTNYELGDEIKLVAAGILKDQKNFLFLIEVLKKFDRKFSLHIYGTGPQKDDLEALIRETEQEGSIHLLGHYPRLYEILKNYDAFIMPSKFEGFGISMMEAMAIGLPVLASDISTLRDIGKDGCEYFQPGNAANFNEKLNLMLNKDFLLAKSSVGRERAIKISGKKAYLHRLKEIYSDSWESSAK